MVSGNTAAHTARSLILSLGHGYNGPRTEEERYLQQRMVYNVQQPSG